jgi:hypothetical protein
MFGQVLSTTEENQEKWILSKPGSSGEYDTWKTVKMQLPRP